MKKSLTILTLLVTLITSLNALVWLEGKCRLDGQTDNSGTKVLFKAASPTAKSDSVYTNIQGVYQILITSGIYNVTYSHNGYFSTQVGTINCFGPLELAEQNLIIKVGIPIAGALSGTLAGPAYLVEGDIRIEPQTELTIMPGTIFYFDGDYSFRIDGGLTASGTKSDSIYFIPSPRVASWRGIWLGDYVSLRNVRLEYCHIEGSNVNGINTDYFMRDGSMYCIINNCTITNNAQNGICSWNHLNRNDLLRIASCRIINNGGGININGSATIVDCSIMNNKTSGIFKDAVGCIDIRNCVVSQNDDGAGASFGIYMLSSDPELINSICNSVITDNPTGIFIGNMGVPTSTNLVNTIISSNNIGIGFFVTDNAITSVTGCNIFDNSENFRGSVPAFIGEKLITNVNGDSCDAFLNIFEDPLFVDAGIHDFHLQANSPCINAGDPGSPLDPDGSVADIGAFYFNTGPKPMIVVSSQNIYFSDTYLDSSKTMPLTIQNNGNVNLVLYGININKSVFLPDWNPADTVIAPGLSMDVNLIYTPHNFDVHKGTVTISNNDRTVSVGLSGACIPKGVNYATSLIVAGGGTDSTNWNYFINNTSPSANDAFSKLAYGRYYTGTRLFYMNPVGWQDLNGDGADDGIIDSDLITPLSVKSAILGLIDDPNSAYPNVISFSGHGHVGELDVNGNASDNINSDSLALWLEQANLDNISPLVVVMEACFSGSFVPVLAGENRIIISACRADQFADYLAGECFSTNFWEEIWYGNNVWDAFHFAFQRAQIYLNGQEPLLEADGNGIPNEATDMAIAKNVYLGGQIMHGALLPEIKEFPAQVSLVSGQVAVTVKCNGTMDRVWFRIFPKDYAGTPAVNQLPVVTMNHTGDFYYTGTYTNAGFIQVGNEYVVRVEALDDVYNHAIPKIIPLKTQASGVKPKEVLPQTFRLSQNYPNPFNPTTTIQYEIPKASNVTITIFNMTGQIVDRLVNQKQEPGFYSVQWDARNISTGVYFYQIKADGFQQVRKMLLIK